MEPSPQFYIGCSGYYYPEWRKNFYPEKMRREDWLAYYSTVFNTVELNGTFYRRPSLANLQKHYAVTPDDFLFSVKMSRYITHHQRLKACSTEIAEFTHFMEEGLRDKLSCLLYQLSPSFEYSTENLELILETVPSGPRQVIEFRNKSWWREETWNALKANGLTVCNPDYPGLQPAFETTSSRFYMRFHGVPNLFKSDYSQVQLYAYYGNFPVQEKNFIYFNNTYHGHAHQNALALMKIAAREYV